GRFTERLQAREFHLDYFSKWLEYSCDHNASAARNMKGASPYLPVSYQHFTNDVQISIGDAHSGYPVMNSSFSPNSTTLPTIPLV
ncbi:hypothetical protein NLO46_25585, partial [Escherichia coli]|nr:hypothetical protein [Escherichia coli]